MGARHLEHATYAYVNNDTAPNSITAYAIGLDGTLVDVPGSPFAAGGDGSANYHPDAIKVCGDSLFATNQSTTSVAGFFFLPNGALSMRPGWPTTTQPGTSWLGVACGGQLLFGSGSNEVLYTSGPSTNWNGGVYQLDGPPGLAAVVGTDLPSWASPGGSHPSGLSRDPLRGLLFVADGPNNVHVLADQLASGSLNGIVEQPGSPYSTTGNTSSAALSRDGLFLAAEGAGSVHIWTVGPTGALTSVAGSPFLDPTGCEVAGLAWAPSAGRLFVGHRACSPGKVMVFDVSSSGVLTAVPGAPFATGGDDPVGLAVDLGGARLLVAHFQSSTTAVLSVGTNGTLTPIPGSPFANPANGHPSSIVLR